MKFTCESCTTRYEIPDEKVAGRMLRVRCKRCRAVMEVVGPAAPDVGGQPRLPTRPEKVAAWRGADAQEALDVADDRPMFSARQNWDPFVAAGGSGIFGMDGQAQELSDGTGAAMVAGESQPVAISGFGTPVWYVAIKGQSRGPFTFEEVELLARRGRIHTRTRVWSAGMDAWVRVLDVADLSYLRPYLADRSPRSSSGELTPVVGSAMPGPIEAVRPTRPFANLLSSASSFAVPPLSNSELTPPPLGGTGGTGWFAVTADQVEHLFDQVPSSPQVCAMGSVVTGVHLLRRRRNAVVYALGGLGVFTLVGLALLMLPMLLDAPDEMMVRETDRSPVAQTTVVALGSEQTWNKVLQMRDGEPARVVVAEAAPVETPVVKKSHKGRLEKLTHALSRSAQRLFKGKRAQH